VEWVTVYQATDTKLERSVAIKFLSEGFSTDGECVARFQREARVLASLNHPNVAGIHGVEEINGRHFLIMDLVPGETRADRIARAARFLSTKHSRLRSRSRQHSRKRTKKGSSIAIYLTLIDWLQHLERDQRIRDLFTAMALHRSRMTAETEN
jgi:serine/threonine protein kinase